MSIQRWWEERLRARAPLGSASVAILGYNYKARPGTNDTWPRAVARPALYEDYLLWFEDFTLKPMRATPFYEANLDKMPKPKAEHDFFVANKAWLYFDKGLQVRNYMVTKSKHFEDKWVEIRVRRYFIRLGSWEEHVQMFLDDTGIDCSSVRNNELT